MLLLTPLQVEEDRAAALAKDSLMTVNVTLFDSLEAVERDAGDALARRNRPWLFDRLDWLKLVRDHTPPAGRLLGVKAQAGDAAAWLFVTKQGRRATAYSNWYCLRFGTILLGNKQGRAAAGLVRGLRRAGVSWLFLSPLAKDDPLVSALKRAGWLVRMSASNVNWNVTTKGMRFEDYWAQRPSKLRNTVKRRARAAALDIQIYQRFDEQAWRDYVSVYEASWKPAEGSPDLMRELARQEGEAGSLRLGVAYHEGQPVAAQFWITENKVATIHKLAYREDAKQHSPGSILSMEMFRRAIDVDQVDMIDFGVGNDGYKADWMSTSVPLYMLTAHDLLRPAGLFGLVRAATNKLVARLRRA